ncbi:Abi family protein [Limosilactobacillus sp. Lr3000]|uniref:Abi family protein n=1 Tax=Limosilactobacillus albertensis TaxID=2759752 RepID=A0A839GYV2_9LACO|nr:Abi family protein [Limosilactobacillus albertensis]MBB1123363.1 Abi family protein [Limosilactobacillus albertensis]MCD7121224.1 Abi family protein [Limosilactobacillus albertensis]
MEAFLFVEKEFKLLEQQLEIIKSRGINISDDNKVKDYLLTNNYYNIINGYSKPFLRGREDYLPGTKFNEIKYLYFFDEEIKRLLFHGILLAEHHIKSVLAYRFAEAYPNKKYAYLDVDSFDHSKSIFIAYIVNKLNQIIKKNKRYHNNAISHYAEHYHDVPIWVLVDFIDFGELQTLLKVLEKPIQNKIARDLTKFIRDNIPDFETVFPPETMLSLIANIHEVRNICAHNKRLIYFKCREDSLYFSALDEKYNISPADERRGVYTTFLSLQCFLSKTEYAELNNSIRKRIRHILTKQINTIDINSIITLYGFPNDWYNLPSISQG